MDENDAVQQAIQNSLEQHGSLDDVQHIVSGQEELDYDALKSFIKEHASSEVNEDYRNITVSRLSVWQTAEPYYRRSRFLASKGMLRVSFATFEEEEDAVDHGGPRREFFHLLIGGILRESSTLTGSGILDNEYWTGSGSKSTMSG